MAKKRDAKPEAILQPLHSLTLTPPLTQLMDEVYYEVREFARWKWQDPNLEDFSQQPELEAVTDALFLIRSGALQVEFRDSFTEDGRDAILLQLKV